MSIEDWPWWWKELWLLAIVVLVWGRDWWRWNKKRIQERNEELLRGPQPWHSKYGVDAHGNRMFNAKIEQWGRK